jgi:hypothetical protein
MRNAKLLCLGLALLLSGCGHSADVTTPTASPTPAPAPPKKLVVVGITGVLNGAQGVDVVAAGVYFKINATANRCYLDEVQVECNSDQFSIPYWHQDQVGGAPCGSVGSIDSASVQYKCNDVGDGRLFRACAQDFDKTEIGCATWKVDIQ